MKSGMSGALILVTCLLLSAIAGAQGKEPPAFRTKFTRELIDRTPALVCARVATPPKIDGEVDRDPVWSGLPPNSHTAGAWVQLGTKTVSARQTVVYSCFDDENLYFAFVCEEAELQNVQMDGLLGSGHMLGADDFVEVAIEVGGLRGEGQVYSFRANSRASAGGWGGLGVPNSGAVAPLDAKMWHIPACRSAGKFGPNRWMVEMAIPFATLKKRPEQKGLAAPSRGDVLGLKLARYGAAQQDPKNRMISTWNTDIVYPYLHICGSNGLFYFEDSNTLVDGDFSAPEGKSPWKKADDALRQDVSVHPGSYYIFRVKSEGDAPELSVDGKKLELKDAQVGFWSAADRTKASVMIKTGTRTKVKKVAMEYEPGEEPPGLSCLTNNYRRAERNIRALQPDAPEGRYQYVRIDYAGRITSDDNPGLKFVGNNSTYQSWAYDFNLRVEDLGGKEGWVPFSKGSLTARHKPVFWNPVNPGDPACWGRHPIILDVDLGQEYYVQGLDLLWPGPNIINVEIWGKAKEEEDWMLLDMSAGQYVEPGRHRPRRGWDSVRDLDSVLRYVRFRVTPQTGDWSYPQMDGIQEFWVWGLPKGDHAGVKAFKPWVSGNVVPKVLGETDVLDGENPLIVPRPRAMTLKDGWFLLNRETRIVAQDHAEARRVAKQIHDEVLRRWQLDLSIVVEGSGPEPLAKNVIYLSCLDTTRDKQPKRDERARAVAREEKLDWDQEKPQGYALHATPARVVILGNDDLGLYYGAQSLMMAMRWRNALVPSRAEGADGGAAGVRCMKVLDWPGTVLERGVYHRRPYPVMLVFPESDVGRIKRICQLMSRFKFNVIYLGPDWHNGLTAGPRMTPWAKKLLPQICREVREEYHIEIRPTILYEEGEGGSYWENLSEDALDLREHNPDEDPAELGNSLNLCPLDERTYARHFAKIDEILDDFDHPSKVWMFGQTYTSAKEGARWCQCRRCLKSGKTPEELYAYFISRIAQHLEARQTKGLFRCPWLVFGDEPDPKDRRMIRIDPRKLPANLEFDLWDREDPNYTRFTKGRDFIERNFKPGLTANGPPDWPSSERYLQDAPQAETDMLVGLSGSSSAVWSQIVTSSLLCEVAEQMWHSPDPRPRGELDDAALSDFVYSWWFGHDFPAWRAGVRPGFVPLDLRPFANHISHPTGTETMEPGRPPEIDLRYLPTGLQTLAGVPFDVIDPATNAGKGLLMLGRPAPGTLSKVAATISESAGPIPVGRKLASLAFLRIRWHCRTEGMSFEETWLRPTCRVVYDDDSWLVADSFLIWHAGLFFDEWNNVSEAVRPFYRLGWKGNCPTMRVDPGTGRGPRVGRPVTLRAVEWVNPYPEKTIKHIEFVTPDFTDQKGKRVSDMMEAFVAITGVEPTAHDFAFWKDRPGRDPLLPPRKEKAGGVELKFASDLRQRNDGTWITSVRTPAGVVNYTVKPRPGSGCDRHLNEIYDLAYCEIDFRDFGVEVTFEQPLHLQSVDVRGPLSLGAHWGAYTARTKKADVTVEVSEDGKTWRKAGELRGISADADFLPVDLGGAAVKTVRMKGTAGPYREHYHPVQVQGDIFWRNVKHYNPSFVWRFIAPGNSPVARTEATGQE